MADAPMELVARLRSDTVVAGEDVVLELDIVYRSGGSIDPVELNKDRTVVAVRRLPDGPLRRLTGADHMELHAVHPQEQLSQPMTVRPGLQERARVPLGRFTLPLETGRHSIELSYRWDPRTVVRANAVEVSVQPARAAAASIRWLGAGDARTQSAWVVRLEPHAWLLRAAPAHDPRVVLSALCYAGPPDVQATFAHLNDNLFAQYERRVVWTAGSALFVLPVMPFDVSPVRRWDVGAGTSLVDPPLQRRDGGVSAVLLGPAGLVVVVTPAMGEAPVTRRELALGPARPHALAVAWAQAEDEPAGAVFALHVGPPSRLERIDIASGARSVVWTDDQECRAARTLLLDQWLGVARPVVLLEEPPEPDQEPREKVLRALSWDGDEVAAAAAASKPAPLPSELAAYAVPDESVLLRADVVPFGQSVALLLGTAKGRLAVGPELRAELPPAREPGWLLVDEGGSVTLVEAEEPAAEGQSLLRMTKLSSHGHGHGPGGG